MSGEGRGGGGEEGRRFMVPRCCEWLVCFAQVGLRLLVLKYGYTVLIKRAFSSCFYCDAACVYHVPRGTS